MMTKKKLNEKVHLLRELEREVSDMETEIEHLKDELKSEMINRGVENLSGEDWEISWKTVQSRRFDQSLLKEDLPNIFERYKVLKESKRFSCK